MYDAAGKGSELPEGCLVFIWMQHQVSLCRLVAVF